MSKFREITCFVMSRVFFWKLIYWHSNHNDVEIPPNYLYFM